MGCKSDSSQEVFFDLRDPIRVKEIATLPAEIALGVDYPVEYEFTNIDPVQTAEGLRFTNNFPPQFNLTTDTCSGKTRLNALESCTIAGTFRADNPGNFSFGARVEYQGGKTLEWVVNTTAVAVRISATPVRVLPANIAFNRDYPIEVTFRNIGSRPAQIDGLTIMPNDGFIQGTHNCPSVLNAGNSCAFNGTARATMPNTFNFSIDLRYNNIETASYSGTTRATDVPITGTVVEELPIHTTIRPAVNPTEKYPVTFRFSNDSNVDAVDIRYTKHYPPGFTETSNNCFATLPANSSCSISGEFLPVQGNYGKFAVSVTANYESGKPVEVRSETQVTDFNNINASLGANDVHTPKLLFTFAQLTKTPNVAGNPFLNAFLVLPSVQRMFAPYVRTFVTETIYNGPLIDTRIDAGTTNGQPVTLLFRAKRPSCVIQSNHAEIANRQLNDRTACSVNPSERHVTVRVDETSYNALPPGNNYVNMRLSNQYFLGDFTGPGDFSNMAILSLNIQK